MADYGEGTGARKFATYPITGEEAQRISRIANGLRVMHTNGCIYDDCPECDLIRELEQILVWRYGTADLAASSVSASKETE